MISINTNYGGLFASKAASQSQRTLDTAMERLSSGMRINYAKDDAAGQAISTRLTAEIEGIAMASRNAADAQSMIDTAEGALQETHNLLLRMRDWHASFEWYVKDDDRTALNAEYQQLETNGRIDQTQSGPALNYLLELPRLFISELKLLTHFSILLEMKPNASGGTAGIIAQIDTDNDSTADADADILTQAKAQASIAVLDGAIKTVSEERGKLGAVSNRLSHNNKP